jgi:hypothetical protein
MKIIIQSINAVIIEYSTGNPDYEIKTKFLWGYAVLGNQERR